MELTYGILYDLIKGKLAVTSPPKAKDQAEILEILPWTGENRDASILYLAEAPLQEMQENVLTIGPVCGSGWSVQVQKDGVLSTVSCILQAAQAFQRWQHQCALMAEAEHDMAALMKMGTSLMGFHLSLVDRDYQLRSDPGLWDFDQEDPWQTLLPLHALEDLYSENPGFDETFALRGLHPYPQYPIAGHQFYYYNLYQDTFYLGRLLIAIPDEIFGPGSLQAAAYLGSLTESCYQYQYLHQNQTRQGEPVFRLVGRLFSGASIEPEEREALFQMKGWPADSRYRVLYLVSNGYIHSEQTLKYYAKQFEAVFPSCVAVQLGGGVFCLQNLTAAKEGDFRQKLSGFLRENLFRAGISNDYGDISETYRYRCQAESAMELGQRRDPALWRYDFCDYTGDYVLSKCTEQFDSRDICPRNLLTILDYHREHPENQYLETIRQYYYCQFNAQLAASRLFIHRTTFFYRLNRIQKIAAFHPEDPWETMQILLALQAMEGETL